MKEENKNGVNQETDKMAELDAKINNKVKEIMNVADESNSFMKKEAEDGRFMAILSYFSILSLIPYFSEKNNKFVMYHAKQGVNLLIIEVIIYAVTGILTRISFIFSLINFISMFIDLSFIALSVIGIVNVINNKAKELPIVGKYKIIK